MNPLLNPNNLGKINDFFIQGNYYSVFENLYDKLLPLTKSDPTPSSINADFKHLVSTTIEILKKAQAIEINKEDPSFRMFEKAISRLLESLPLVIATSSKFAYQDVMLAKGAIRKILGVPVVVNYLSDFNKFEEYERSGINQFDSIEVVYHSINNDYDLEMLSRVAKDWKVVINSFARLVDDNNSKVEIASVRRGSLVLDIVIHSSSIMLAITTASKLIAKEFARWLIIKEKALELKKLMGENESAQLDNIQKAINLDAHGVQSKVSEQLIEKYFGSNKSEVEKNEAGSFLNKSIGILMKFIDKGGEVKPNLLKPSVEQIEETDELAGAFTDVKSSRAKIISITTGKEVLLLDEHIDNDEIA